MLQNKIAARPAAQARLSRRAVKVEAKVNLQPGAPRVIKGRCFVTRDVSAFVLYSPPNPTVNADWIHGSKQCRTLIQTKSSQPST